MRASPAVKGKAAEEAALKYLQQRKLKLLQKNFHCRRGEIDLIMQDGVCTVFVEVRQRRQWQTAADSVDYFKQRRLVAAAEHYLSRARMSAAMCRFDVVAINHAGDIQWHKNAFDADDAGSG